MDSKCTFVPSSLSVSECDNGTWRELAKEQYKTALDLVDEGAGKQQRLTLKLPDKKYLKIEYDVIASGESSKVSLSNKAELEGVADGYVKHGREYDIDAGASGGGTGYGIVVHKVDEKDVTVPLAGATFKLYEIDMDKARGSAGVDGAKTLFPPKRLTLTGVRLLEQVRTPWLPASFTALRRRRRLPDITSPNQHGFCSKAPRATSNTSKPWIRRNLCLVPIRR